MERLIALSFCIAAISFTISTTSIFKWLRDLISAIHPKLEELIHCPYCLSHWITFAVMIPLVGLYQPVIISGIYLYDFIINIFAITGLCALQHFIMLRAYEPVTRAMLRKELEKLND